MVLQHSGHSGGPALWGGDLGPNSADGEGPGQFPVQGRAEDYGEATAETEVRELGIPTAGGGNKGGGNGGDTDIYYTEAEYGRAIYCDTADSGPMRAGHPAARSAGVSEVVVAGGDRPRGIAETGGGISNKIGDRYVFKGGVGQGDDQGSGRRRGGVSGSEWVQWSGVEDD